MSKISNNLMIRPYLIGLLLYVISLGCFGYPTSFTVAKDSSGDFETIQAAIFASKAFPDRDITIFIKNAIYHEKVEIFAWNTRVTMIGESREGTIIRYDDHFNKLELGRNSTFHTYTLKVMGDDFRAANLTIENTAGPVGQAVALHVEADRAAFVNVAIKGYQDTVYVAGEGRRSYFKDCLIEGTVDFIFGAGTAYFEQCEIRSLRSNSYITAASTPPNQAGLVFQHCHFSRADDVENVYLGRPWRAHAKTVIMASQLDEHIIPQGWHDWNDTSKQKTVFYAEYANEGPGSALSQRVKWAQNMIDPSGFQKEIILRGWKPIIPAL
jgi:pectinesterase